MLLQIKPLGKWFKSEGILLGIALLTPLALQSQVLDAYVVSTPSMEPTIEGDPNNGDRVLVDKLWDNLSHPSRFHLVVFRHKTKTVVKRIVGLPNEWFKIEDFDLWVGQEAETLKRIQKSPSKDLDMFATYWDSKRTPGGFKGKRWILNSFASLQKGRLLLNGTRTEEESLFSDAERIHTKKHQSHDSAWQMQFTGTITTGYIDGFNRLKEASNGQMSAARDFGIQANIHLGNRAKLWILYRYFNEPYVLVLGGRRVRVWKDGKLLSQSPILPKLQQNKEFNITLVFLDGRFCLAVNNKDIWMFEPKELSQTDIAMNLFPGNDLMIAATGGQIQINELKVIHDFHYFGIGEYGSWKAVRLQKKQYFVLGDNSQDSQDSRHFGPILGDNIIGRPLMVAAPKGRIHIFPR